jgi:hypothetical protein
MPHIETKVDEAGRLVFKVRPDPPEEEWKATKMSLKILDKEDVSAGLGPTSAHQVHVPDNFKLDQGFKQKSYCGFSYIGVTIV